MAAKRRRLKDLTVKEVSLVGLGANQPARVALWKSADVPASDAAPAPADPSTSTASLSAAAGDPASAPSANTDASKSAQPASQEKLSMDEKDKAAFEKTVAEQAELVKSLQDKLAATEAEKVAEAAKAAAAVTERDAAKATIAKAERESLVLKTTVEVKDAFKALPGVAFDKFAIDIIELREKPELAKRFEAVLKAASDAIAGSDLFKTVGNVVKSDTAMTGEQAYEQLVVKTMTAEKLTRDQAVVKVLDTPEGRAAYGQIVSISADAQ